MNVPTLDKCPGYNLYIGGFIALRRPQALRNANITHIVSVLDWKFEHDTPLVRGYQHLHIPVDDVEDENLLEWFPRSNPFIHGGLEHRKSQDSSGLANRASKSPDDNKGSGVLIHCAMGKSRSATILLAYLLWSTRHCAAYESSPQSSSEDPDMISLPTKPLTVVKALQLLRRGRGIAEPNEGFMDQLHMYVAMGCPTSEVEMKKHKIYRRWMNKRSVEESLRVNMAPEMAAIQFEDEADDADELPTTTGSLKPNEPQETRSQGSIKDKPVSTIAPGIKAPDGTSSVPQDQTPRVTLKCRKCRHNLATSPFILTHIPPPHTDPAFHNDQPTVEPVGSPSSKCAHVFLHPLSWMRPVLAEGQMEGRLSCPKCNTNIGKFAWSGMRCSCGGWVTPGFGVTRGKVDEIVVQQKPPGVGRDTGSAVRLPPGMRKASGNL